MSDKEDTQSTAAACPPESALLCGEWQPIETIPHDLYVDVWVVIPHSANGGRRITDVCRTDQHSKGWVGLEGYMLSTDVHPTHWMPIPNGPST
jgi:hypothetical protein